jgi:phosphonate metabolism protein PhnN/1,5-bisphosphokinase (PRPP-forming)
MRACAALASDSAGFRVKLKVGLRDGFLALVPDGDPAPLHILAARCVRELDGFRRPLSEEELARRRKVLLTARQDANLLRWGYPYVLDDFRFHMTLTERLEPGDAGRLVSAAQAHFATELGEPVMIDGLTLFQEPECGAPFLALRHFPFTISAEAGHLVLVVGPSGAGKDSVLNGARERFREDRSVVFPRRFVTRLSNAAAEDHVSLTEMEFAIAVADDSFALWWRAHGNCYGIGRSIEGDLAAGAVVAVNCSREVINEAAERFCRLTVVEITAPADVLVSRIVVRGRETPEEALRRVSRQVAHYPQGITLVRIMNDGPLERAVEQLCAVLKDPVADPGRGTLDSQHQQENGKDDGRGLVVVEHL